MSVATASWVAVICATSRRRRRLYSLDVVGEQRERAAFVVDGYAVVGEQVDD
jgi:hypothetical protein